MMRIVPTISKSSFIYIFFVLMLVIPSSFQGIRSIYLLFIVCISFATGFSNKLNYNRDVLHMGFFSIIVGVFFVFYGFINLTPGALNVSTVHILWPILFIYYIGYNSDFDNILKLMSTVIIGSIIAILLLSLFIVDSFKFLPLSISTIAEAQDFHIGVYNGFIELHSSNLATILYAFAFSLTIFMIPTEYNKFKGKFINNLNIICLILSLLVIIASGRRAFWVICIVCPIIIVFYFKLCGIRQRRYKNLSLVLLLIAIGAVIFSVLSLDYNYIFREFSSIFDFSGNKSNSLRALQFKALVNAWMNVPILGSGLGGSTRECIRDVHMPWAYELSYIALIFQTGILGFFLYFTSIFWIFIKSLCILRTNKTYSFILLPQLVALLCFLFINSSNPYLGKFDYMWTLFFPICTINAILVYKNKNSNLLV